MDKSYTGKRGENIACRYLRGRGFQIIKRNYRKPWGEIDIIAKTRDGILVFVEVKAVNENQHDGLMPEDNLTSAKLQKLKKTCTMFAVKHSEILESEKGWRIDLVAIDLKNEKPAPWWERILTIYKNNYIIRHYENI